jgi:hypothetical protein
MVSHAINLYLFPQNGFHFGRPQWFPLSEFTVATSAIFDSGIAPESPGQYRLRSEREHFSVTEQQDFDTCIEFIRHRLNYRLIRTGSDRFERHSSALEQMVKRITSEGSNTPSLGTTLATLIRGTTPSFMNCQHNRTHVYVCE